MRPTSILCLTLFLGTAAAFGQTASPDAQIIQMLVTEIRQLRQDLQITAAAIQRVSKPKRLSLAALRSASKNARVRCGQVQEQLAESIRPESK